MPIHTHTSRHRPRLLASLSAMFFHAHVTNTKNDGPTASCRRPAGYRLRAALLCSCALVLILKIIQIGLQSYDQIVVLSQTRSTRDEVSADNVLLEVLQRIDLALNSGLVEHLRRLLERSGRNEARGLQCSTGDTLKYLIRRGGDDVTHLYGLQITTLERRVLVTQLAHRDDLPGLYVLRIACIHDNDLVVEFVVHIHELPLVHYLILEETDPRS